MDDKLYLENKGLLWRWARHYAPFCNSTVDVDDLVQSGFLGLVRARETYKEDGAAWSSWASLYIRTAMQEALGRRRNRPSVLSLDRPIAEDAEETLLDTLTDESAPDAEALILQDDLARSVRAAVDDLEDENARAAIRAVYFDGLTFAQLAEELGISISSVDHRIRKGRKLLAKDRRVKVYLDDLTSFHAHKGVSAFMRDRTSTVEASVLWRERILARLKSADVCGFDPASRARARETRFDTSEEGDTDP